jgi:hypothetical protein
MASAKLPLLHLSDEARFRREIVAQSFRSSALDPPCLGILFSMKHAVSLSRSTRARDTRRVCLDCRG